MNQEGKSHTMTTMTRNTKHDDPCDNVGHWLDFIMNRKG